MTTIISLQETSADFWIAKYNGNYGVYTIKMKVNGNRIDHFSCSCPSDAYPCKHIGIIKSAIDERKTRVSPNENKETVSVGDILDKVSHAELKKFIVEYALYNTELTQKIQLTFLHKLAIGKEGTL